MLDIHAVTAGYGETQILRGVTLNVNAGEIVAVLGANGVGKTTLNHAISGLVKIRSGTIHFLGKTISGTSAPDIVACGLVHVPEGRKIFPNLSVRENLEIGSYRRARERRGKNMDKIFSLFPRLRERAAQLAGTLSGGEQQMLAIGRGLMAEPELIILDEPSLGLSPLLVEELFGLIKRIADDNIAVMLVEQNAVQSLEIASRAYVMSNGLITMSGSAADLRNDPDLQKSYLGL